MPQQSEQDTTATLPSLSQSQEETCQSTSGTTVKAPTSLSTPAVPQTLIYRDSQMDYESGHEPGAQDVVVTQKCPFGTCSSEFEKRNLESHLRENTHIHISSVVEQIQQHEQVVRDQLDEISELDEAVKKLQEQQQRLDILHRQAVLALSAPTGFAPDQRSSSTIYDRDLYLVAQPELTQATYRWRIDDFSKMRRKELQSIEFSVGDLRWFLRVSAPDDNLQLYLRVPHTIVSYPRDWKAHVQMAFGVINQTAEKRSVWRYTTHTFDQNSVSWGYANFLSMDELYVTDCDFVVGDSIIVEINMKVFAESSPRLSKTSPSPNQLTDSETVFDTPNSSLQSSPTTTPNPPTSAPPSSSSSAPRRSVRRRSSSTRSDSPPARPTKSPRREKDEPEDNGRCSLS